jgi:glutamine amidotransferase
MIAIVDIGIGNLGSIVNMLDKCKVKALRTSSVTDIEKADKIILPGVGSFDNFMRKLEEYGLIPVLSRKAQVQRTPIIGICLGMQILGKRSEEGSLPGLGWLDAETVRFKFDGNSLRIPHMGWNTVKIQGEPSIFKDMDEEPRFYFVHSYHLVCKDGEDVLATTHYGYDFTSSVRKGNIYGTQFHPEKSHKFGMRLLKNFSEL